MELSITAITNDDTADSELRSLHDWLLQERPRPGHVGVVAAAPEAEAMGAATDALQVALASGGALSILAGSVSTWLSTRRQSVAVEITRPDGSTLKLDSTTTHPQQALEHFLKFASRED